MTFDQEVRILKAFHDQHSTETDVCAWCHHRVPVEQLTPVTITVDQDTGMSDKEEPVCDECLEPLRKQQTETDAGYEPIDC